MIIFRTHPDHIAEVVRLGKHALASSPKMTVGEPILIAQTVVNGDGGPPIRYVMDFLRIRPDRTGESLQIWGRRWRYIVEGTNCRELKRHFDIRDIQVSSHNYGQGGPYVYVAPADEYAIQQQGLLV